MLNVLSLQKLAVPTVSAGYAGSCTSSWSNCCGDKTVM